ncbi:uncharacterized protein LOC134220217 [Armigeres subalbatus]|uniref:uncharacterized protein LOC134220217 n=1 Tax=Armigeres subalbatus TaxID=124917 RepID=UPI002ED59566
MCMKKYGGIKHCVTTNTYWCIEINAHSIVNYIVLCRDENLPYLPELLHSQTCESFFRTTRSFTSTESTVVNFTMKGFESKLNRIQAKTEIMHDSTNGFDFPRVQSNKTPNDAQTLPTDAEIRKCIEESKAQATDTLLAFGIERSDMNFSESIILRPNASHRRSNREVGKYEFVDVNSLDQDFEEHDEQIECSVENAVGSIETRNPHNDSSGDEIYDAELIFSNVSDTFDLVDSRCPNEKHSFKIRNKNGKIIHLNIRTFLWMLQGEPERCSADRTKRFHEKATNTILPVYNENEVRSVIRRGEWVALQDEENLKIAQVHGFKYLSGRRCGFTLDECPVHPPSSSSSKGVGVTGNFYSVDEYLMLRLDESLIGGNINIENYVSHVKNPIHNGTCWVFSSKALHHLQSVKANSNSSCTPANDSEASK